jgi:hypothetical protein
MVGEKNDIEVLEYRSEFKNMWDMFVHNSKNGVFLFYRDYMEYHSDRFRDCSLLFSQRGKIIGLLPANIKNGILFSHEGLTFGGVISGYDMKVSNMVNVFAKFSEHCKEKGITRIIYKAIPYIYHSIPADEDLYALFRHNAKLIARNISSSIYLPAKINFERRKLETIKKAKKNGLVVRRSFDFKTFMRIEEQVLLNRHGTTPVHATNEIELLADRFPDNIKLFASYIDDMMLAGIVIYESRNVAHGQYAANSDEGRSIGAQDIIEDYLINDHYKAKKYYDFGISTEEFGQVLNIGLIARKEMLGGRAVAYDFYELML